MKTILFIISFLLPLSMFELHAEGKCKVLLGVDAGATVFINSSYNDFDRIRKDVSSYEYEDECFDPYSFGGAEGKKPLTSYYVSFKSEFLLKDHIGFSTGFRVTSFSSDFHNEKGDFFYWRVNDDELFTQYARILNVKQQSLYLGIPLEMKYLFGKPGNIARMYIKAGLALNLRTYTENSVKLKSSSMEEYEGVIEDQIGDPKSLVITFYPCIGFRIGKNKAFTNLEFQLPSVITENASSLMSSTIGLGINLSFQMPVWSSKENFEDQMNKKESINY